jgi:hypothetical protein
MCSGGAQAVPELALIALHKLGRAAEACNFRLPVNVGGCWRKEWLVTCATHLLHCRTRQWEQHLPAHACILCDLSPHGLWGAVVSLTLSLGFLLATCAMHVADCAVIITTTRCKHTPLAWANHRNALRQTGYASATRAQTVGGPLTVSAS